MNEMVYVGKENLVGEVIGLTSQKTTIQVYEETSGLKPGRGCHRDGSAGVRYLLLRAILRIFLMEFTVALKQDRRAQRLLHQPGHQCGLAGYFQKMGYTYYSEKGRTADAGNHHCRGAGDKSDRTQGHGSAGHGGLCH